MKLKIALRLDLYIHNNSKYVRGKKKTKESIEYFLLPVYDMVKFEEDTYDFTIEYTDDENLDKQVYDLLDELRNEADIRSCFSESEVYSLDDPDRSW